MADLWQQIAAHLNRVLGVSLAGGDRRSVGGGCINSGYVLSKAGQRVFVKLNDAAQVGMFEAEAAGLEEMLASQTIRVPRPLCWGTATGSAYLALEWLDLGSGSADSWREMGQRLAAMHRVNSELGQFGWRMNNTIGSTPQPNPWTADWPIFWAEHRLGHQFRLAQRRGGSFPQQQRLLAAVPALLAGHTPTPSLVHGDLWSGNAGVLTSGEPVIFDPATYWGDREVDLAMTELFGGFPAEFYRGYAETYPLEPGYEQRKVLYNLYHMLNHFNLFGGSYAGQANRMIDQLLP
jgi:fructosamine-3-kinase